MPVKKSKTIFISHAASDREIADTVVDLLNTGMGIDVQKEVFCTSLEGLKVPAGMDFKDFIKNQIQEPTVVLMLISQNYLTSQFCLAEVGASWAMSHRTIPVLVPPVRFEDMKAVLVNVHALRIEDPSDWNEALEIFREALDINPNTNRWERKRDEHLERIVSLIKKQKAPPVVPFAKLKSAEEKLAAANEEIKGLEEEVKRLKQLNDAIRKMKDAKGVARIELESLPASKQFEKLVDAAVAALQPLPSVVCEALYYYFRKEGMSWPGINSDDETENVKRAIEKGFLEDQEEYGLSVRESAPKVARAIEALEKLRNFVERQESDFSDAYIEEYDEELEFTSRTFWNHHLL